MLSDLHVRNLAVLEEASVRFGPGFNVLTGETGAGKSIVVDALALLAGARASAELVRSGAEGLSVTGRFEPPAGGAWRAALAEAGLEPEEDLLVVRREVGREGRNRAYLNDQPVTVRLVAEATASLLRIHAQREELELASPEQQRALLDAAGGAEAAALLAATAEAYEAHRGLTERLERVRGDQRWRAERLDWLAFQLREIDAARLTAGEEEELRAERELLRHAESVRSGLGGALEALHEGEGSAGERLAQARRLLEGVVPWLPEAGAWALELAEAGVRVGELARVLRDRLGAVEAEPGRLDAIEERLALLERLFHKHGGGSREVLERRAGMASELAQLEGDVLHRDDLEREAAEALAAYRRAAQQLTARRRVWGGELAARLQRELAELGLAKARFTLLLETRRREGSPLAAAGVPVDFGPAGLDRVSFLLAANPGEEAKPLARSASGGELSRVHLGLQLAARREAPAQGPTMVFDEADAGLGGEAAHVLGRKLKRLARGGQVLAVTHLPQVASHADQHFRVVKRVVRGRTRTAVEVLAGEERVREIARMLAGETATEVALSHAAEMLRAGGSEERAPSRA